MFFCLGLPLLTMGSSSSRDAVLDADIELLIKEYLKRVEDNPTYCEGRLTLVSGTPVPTSDVTAATTVYFTPYRGTKIVLSTNGTEELLNFSETSVAVPSTTNTLFDVFAYSNSGTLALETLSWVDDSTRATDITTFKGIYVKSGDETRRYLGTGRTTAVSGQTEDSRAKRFLWNLYNRKERTLLKQELTDSWTTSPGGWQSANADTTNRVEIVVGIRGPHVSLKLHGLAVPAGDGEGEIGIGKSSTSTLASNVVGGYINYFTPQYISGMVSYEDNPSPGYTYYQWLDSASHSGNMEFYGGTGNDDRRAGLTGFIDG